MSSVCGHLHTLVISADEAKCKVKTHSQCDRPTMLQNHVISKNKCVLVYVCVYTRELPVQISKNICKCPRIYIHDNLCRLLSLVVCKSYSSPQMSLGQNELSLFVLVMPKWNIQTYVNRHDTRMTMDFLTWCVCVCVCVKRICEQC